jgi:hypothetical protein
MIARNENFSFLSIKKITLFILFVGHENRLIANQAGDVGARSVLPDVLGGSQNEEPRHVAKPAVFAVPFYQRVGQAL